MNLKEMFEQAYVRWEKNGKKRTPRIDKRPRLLVGKGLLSKNSRQSIERISRFYVGGKCRTDSGDVYGIVKCDTLEAEYRATF